MCDTEGKHREVYTRMTKRRAVKICNMLHVSEFVLLVNGWRKIHGALASEIHIITAESWIVWTSDGMARAATDSRVLDETNRHFNHPAHHTDLYGKASSEHSPSEEMKHRDNRDRFCGTTSIISRKISPLLVHQDRCMMR